MSFIPQSVVIGFVNALAILIFMAQLTHFTGQSWIMYAMVGGTLAIIYILPRFTKIVPSSLVAIIVMSMVAIAFHLDLRTVGDMGEIKQALPLFHIPHIPLTWEMFTIILPYSFTLALVGILESLMTATILDEMTETKSEKNQEVKG
jgi:SulP family sulfate permease